MTNRSVWTPPDKVILDSVRLHIQAFRFFADPESVDKTGFLKVFSIACDVLDGMQQLENTRNYAINGARFDNWVIMLAAFTILRLLRSEVAPYLDSKKGEQSYFGAIDLFRKLSVQTNDLQARGAIIMAQLWATLNIFRKQDESSDSLRLRIRSRLVGLLPRLLLLPKLTYSQALGVVFDCFWWWRAAFGGQENPYANASVSQSTADRTLENTPLDPNLVLPQAGSLPLIGDGDETILNAEFVPDVVPDWDWATALEMPF